MLSRLTFLSVSVRGCLLVPLLAGALFGCESDNAPPPHVARVGDHYLTQTKLERLLDGMGPVPDSTEARQQVIDQWIRRTLLLREAKQLNLEKDSEVKRKLKERRRSILVTAFKNRLFEDTEVEPSDEEVRTYFERHEDQLALREPYVRVRHLATNNQDSAQAVRRAIRRARDADVDSVWTQLGRRYARDPERALDLSARFLPERRLFARLPAVQDALAALRDGQVAPIIEDNNHFHVLQLVRRISEGAEPKLRWMESEIRRRLRIRNRKQMYAREVERLRNEAKANNLIETP